MADFQQMKKGTGVLRFGFVVDTPPPQLALGTYLTIKCAWCGQHKLAITDRNCSFSVTTICRECANRLLNSRSLYQA